MCNLFNIVQFYKTSLLSNVISMCSPLLCNQRCLNITLFKVMQLLLAVGDAPHISQCDSGMQAIRDICTKRISLFDECCWELH